MCALACIIVFEHSRGSMMLGADWLSRLGSTTDSRQWEGGEAVIILLVLGLLVTIFCKYLLLRNKICYTFDNLEGYRLSIRYCLSQADVFTYVSGALAGRGSWYLACQVMKQDLHGPSACCCCCCLKWAVTNLCC